jgi:hypothetical protein
VRITKVVEVASETNISAERKQNFSRIPLRTRQRQNARLHHFFCPAFDST